MPTAADLTRMRATVTVSLPDTATILRRTLTDDGNGGKAASHASVGTTRAALAYDQDAPMRFDQVSGEQIRPEESLIITTPYDTDVRETDRLTLNSATFEVISLVATKSRQLDIRLRVKRV